ncbi:gamma-glutamylputrescine oxidase [Nitratireductor aquimarinus]|uniref:NAD(P)/FAD-dependent oxidoreductase n=1 Tax=Nitratireductor aquimarinus TaxID=889300 RepID=UPI003B5B268A
MNYIETFYSRTLADAAERPPLEGVQEADCCIIGGGLAGLSTAFHLTEAGKSVILLEENRIGWGASGRNGGFVSPGYAHGRAAIAGMVGQAHGEALHRLSIEGMRLVRQHIDALGLDEATPRHGIMSVVRYDTGESLRCDAETMRERFDYPLTFMDTEEVRAELRSERYFQALRDDQAFHFHPLNYLRGLAGTVEKAGGQIFEQSPAVALHRKGAISLIDTPNGQVKARDLVIATGGYTGSLSDRLKRAYLPIATYVLLSEDNPELIASAIRTRHAVGDNRRAGDYYRLVDDGRRILWGGRITTRAASTKALARELRAEMVSTFPQLADLRVELAWSGMMSYARHRMPQIGSLGPNVWHCTAFGGHGMNTTAIGGKVVAEAILGDETRLRLFAPFGLAWAGGAVGLAVAQTTFWKLKMQDKWQEWRSQKGG